MTGASRGIGAAGDAPAWLAQAALASLGAVDILVNNAAVAARLDTVDTDAALIDELLASTRGRRCCSSPPWSRR